MRLNGKTALITGAASGIGRATSILFAREGARVAVTDRSADGAREVVSEIEAAGGEAFALELDVRDAAAWELAVDEILDRGRLDILVANAGISFAKPLADTSLDEWRAVHAVNLDGAFLGIKHVLPAMRDAGGGSIVLVSSASGVRASAGASAYCTSKAAVRMLAKAASLECAAAGVRVNAVTPAGVRTPMWEGMPFFESLVREHGESNAWEALGSDSPMGRLATAEEVAQGILFLASPESSYVTGSDLRIDGGYTA